MITQADQSDILTWVDSKSKSVVGFFVKVSCKYVQWFKNNFANRQTGLTAPVKAKDLSIDVVECVGLNMYVGGIYTHQGTWEMRRGVGMMEIKNISFKSSQHIVK